MKHNYEDMYIGIKLKNNNKFESNHFNYKNKIKIYNTTIKALIIHKQFYNIIEILHKIYLYTYIFYVILLRSIIFNLYFIFTIEVITLITYLKKIY